MAEIAQNDQNFDFLLCLPFHHFLNGAFVLKIPSRNVGEQYYRLSAPRGPLRSSLRSLKLSNKLKNTKIMTFFVVTLASLSLGL